MEKRLLISEIVPKLDQMGIVYTLGHGTDIAIECAFLDAGWGSGNKKIQYTSRVYFDESANTVTMWELTKEIGSGLSFGGDSETSFQSGATLFRKVKSMRYGPDGKAYEYNLNLGAIPKAFKETAKAHGWKFKTVLRPDKASYPPGYTVPANANQQQAGFTSGQPVENNPQQENISITPPPFQQYQPSTKNAQTVNAVPSQPQVPGANSRASHMPGQKYSDPNSTFYARGGKKKDGIKVIIFWIGFLLLAIFASAMFSYSQNSILGWGMATLLFVLLFALRRALQRKDCLIEIIVWLAAAAVLFLIFSFTMGGTSGALGL